MQFFQTPSIDFISRRRVAYVFSAGLFLVGMIAIIIRGGPNLGIDFKGGTSIGLKFQDPMTTVQIRDALTPIGLGTSEIKTFGSHGEFIIYVAQQRGLSAAETAEQVQQAITDNISGVRYEVLQVETVGPKIGQELRKAAILAILASMLLILIYVGWRFELVFSVGAIVALFHDVLITLGIFTFVHFEVSLKEIAAFLTLVGYSLNDTIVVYDRIRENLKIMRSENLTAIINKSINQVLSRTIITSGTTAIVTIILFLFGGEVIRGFAFVMTIGVIIGTYSSIFVASPLVLEWARRHGDKEHLRMAKKKLK